MSLTSYRAAPPRAKMGLPKQEEDLRMGFVEIVITTRWRQSLAAPYSSIA